MRLPLRKDDGLYGVAYEDEEKLASGVLARLSPHHLGGVTDVPRLIRRGVNHKRSTYGTEYDLPLRSLRPSSVTCAPRRAGAGGWKRRPFYASCMAVQRRLTSIFVTATGGRMSFFADCHLFDCRLQEINHRRRAAEENAGDGIGCGTALSQNFRCNSACAA